MQEVFLTPHHLGIAMEYVDGGDLAQWVQMHRIPDVRTFLLADFAGCWPAILPDQLPRYMSNATAQLQQVYCSSWREIAAPHNVTVVQIADTEVVSFSSQHSHVSFFRSAIHMRMNVLQRGLPEGDARWLFQQIALAVDFCHRLGIALRDIKVSAITCICAMRAAVHAQHRLPAVQAQSQRTCQQICASSHKSDLVSTCAMETGAAHAHQAATRSMFV